VRGDWFAVIDLTGRLVVLTARRLLFGLVHSRAHTGTAEKRYREHGQQKPWLHGSGQLDLNDQDKSGTEDDGDRRTREARGDAAAGFEDQQHEHLHDKRRGNPEVRDRQAYEKPFSHFILLIRGLKELRSGGDLRSLGEHLSLQRRNVL
jgi:hypothetical protein